MNVRNVLVGWLIVMIMVAGAGLTAVVLAEIPDADGTINACYTDHKNAGGRQGAVRLVEGPENCKANEVFTSWNHFGPRGATGLAGPKGPTGPAGESAVALPSVGQLVGPVAITVEGTGVHVVSDIFFSITLASGELDVDLTPSRTAVKYIDPNHDITFTRGRDFLVKPLGSADIDLILEPGETFELRIPNMKKLLAPLTGAGTTFTIDVISRHGSILQFQRTIPADLPVAGVVIELP